MILLKAQGIRKRFGSHWALRDVSFSVHEREILGLIGPNGAGKTTLFECLAGLTPMDAGQITRTGLFYLPDSIRPWADQRVEWALGFIASVYRTNGAPLIKGLKLERLLRARIGSLSKGELKRVSLALALLTPHPLLLLDEPFDGLDFRQTWEVMALLRSYPSKGRTLFLSIHQLNDAARVCDRLVLLSDGQVAGEGTIDELRGQARLSEGGLEEIFLALA